MRAILMVDYNISSLSPIINAAATQMQYAFSYQPRVSSPHYATRQMNNDALLADKLIRVLDIYLYYDTIAATKVSGHIRTILSLSAILHTFKIFMQRFFKFYQLPRAPYGPPLDGMNISWALFRRQWRFPSIWADASVRSVIRQHAFFLLPLDFT